MRSKKAKKRQEGKRATETQGRRPCEDRGGNCRDASASRAMPRTAGSPRSWEKHETDPPSLTNPAESWRRGLGESTFSVVFVGLWFIEQPQEMGTTRQELGEMMENKIRSCAAPSSGPAWAIHE